METSKEFIEAQQSIALFNPGSINTYNDPKEDNDDEPLILSLIELYAEVLNCDINQISKETGFFEMGGHSINAIKVLSRLRKEHGLKLSYSSFVKSNKIKNLANMLVQEIEVLDFP